MWESCINSIMTTSMQLAEEVLKHGSEGESSDESQNTTFEGLELFAQTLDTVLARVKVRFIDTIIRLEYVPQSSPNGVGLEIHIKKSVLSLFSSPSDPFVRDLVLIAPIFFSMPRDRVDYYDMAGLNEGNSQGDQGMNEKSAYATKKFALEGVTLFSDEFASNEKTQSRSCSSVSESYLAGSGQSLERQNSLGLDSLVLCGKLTGRHEVTIRIKQCDTLPGPKVDYFKVLKQLDGI